MPNSNLHHTIAIIDDDESILDSLNMVLEDQGWKTQTYISGDSFIADFEQHVPDCIILDSHFPGTSGAEVVRLIKTKNKSVPIIVLTAYPQSQETTELMDLGASEILAKPIRAEILIDRVQRIL